jgi:nucleolar protein 56
VDHILFKGSAKDMASRFSSDRDEAALARALSTKGHDVVTTAKIEGFEHDPDNLGRRRLTEDLFKIALDLGIHKTEDQVRAIIKEVGILVATKDLGADKGGKELQGAQAVKALDDMDLVIDRLGQRLREWFLVEHPGHIAELPDPEEFAEVMASRYPWTTSAYHKRNLDSIRAILDKEDKGSNDLLVRLAQRQADLFEDRRNLEGHIQRVMEEATPCLSEVAGPVLAARLVAEAGSLERLAKMAATTVQILGAKRALFRHLRSGDAPPKHGLLFIHPHVSGAKWWQRGKITKALATCVVRAARSDAFGDGDNAKALKKDLEKKVATIKRKNKEAPAKDPPTRAAPRKPFKRRKGRGQGRGRQHGRGGSGRGRHGKKGPRKGGKGRRR